jgi:putative ABC transport system ATP-binding protein
VGVTAAALEARSLYRFYHDADTETVALAGVSLRVEAGEMVAVVGPSGSGKSTLLACLAGLDIPDGGTVLVAGTPISRRSERDRAAIRARSIGVLLQTGNLVDHLTVADNIAVTQRLARRQATGRPDLLERLGLADRAGARPAHLSGGEAVRAGLAVALANDPDVVLADEPTGELDSASAAGVTELLADAACRGGAIVVVTHTDSVADRADRRVDLCDGHMSS